MEQTTSDPTQVVLFGATGDLARRKLFPALAAIAAEAPPDQDIRIVAVARRSLDAATLEAAVAPFIEAGRVHEVQALLERTTYMQADVADPASLARLAEHLNDLPGGRDTARLCYLALKPDLFLQAVNNLVAADVIHRCAHDGMPARRVLVEKPFGTSLATARELNEGLHELLEEEQIFRIDHYLGKETVQNLLGFRFHNAIFEPLWNRHHVELVEITVAETVGMESGRGAYYDGSGAVRDMLQNHMLQVLALVAMEPPISLDAQAIRDQKVQVLRGLVPPDPQMGECGVVRAQYLGADMGGQTVPGYLQEAGVAEQSSTETYVGVRAEVDTWRWSGVPFIMRHGKRLAARMTEVRVQFRTPPLQLFNKPPGMDDRELRAASRSGSLCDIRPNVLTISIQPEERIRLGFGVKRPGADMIMAPAELEFDYKDHFGEETAPAYQRLLVDAIQGDPTLFLRGDEIEASWAFADQVLLDFVEADVPIHTYEAGTWGPEAANALYFGCESGGL